MSRDPRPLALRLEDGAILPGAVEAGARNLALDFCDIDGFGELAWIELQTAGAEVLRRFEGPLDLLTLRGRLRRVGEVVLADFACTVSRTTDNGIQLLGGKLIGARARFVELRLIALSTAEDQVSAASTPEPLETAGLPEDLSALPASAAEPGLRRPAVPGTGPSLGERWAAALEESRRQERMAREQGWDDDDGLVPERGEIVNHRQFGSCKVIRVDDEHITLRKPDGRKVQLGLAVLRFRSTAAIGGVPTYDVEVRRS